MSDVIQTYQDLTPREQQIAEQMRQMLEFISRGDSLTTDEGRTGHAHQVVGWAQGAANNVLRILGEQP